MRELTPDRIKELIARLDEVCRQAEELQTQLRARMLERARANDRIMRGQPPATRKKAAAAPRKRR